MMKPQIYSTSDALPPETRRIDRFDAILGELFFLQRPEVDKRLEPPQQVMGIQSVWAYYPSLNTAVRIPEEAVYHSIRTARNRNLITEVEQKTFREARVGICGLSVGSLALACLVQTGGPRTLKIADPDTVEISNLNRIRANLTDIGSNKTHVAAREAWGLDPFLEIEMWDQGVTAESLEKFVSDPKLSVFVDEMDAIPLKLVSRRICKTHRIPVVMATDNGDSAILDVERFDIEPERSIFHGRVEMHEAELQHLDRETFVRLANQIIDPKMFTERQWNSIQEVGKSLSGIPQLGTAAMIAGAAVSFAVRQIAINAPLESGRYVLGCDAWIKQRV